jgi:cobalamin biosynthesis protein CobD/CbiB
MIRVRNDPWRDRIVLCEVCPESTPKFQLRNDALNTSSSTVSRERIFAGVAILLFLVIALHAGSMFLVVLSLIKLCHFAVILWSYSLLFSLGQNSLKKRCGGE